MRHASVRRPLYYAAEDLRWRGPASLSERLLSQEVQGVISGATCWPIWAVDRTIGAEVQP